jgi:ATP-dependent helicase/nuclease subunit B
VQIRFLLGPAGSGKTHRCLADIRGTLQNNPEGHPLILLAPKQATFQLERQLLGDQSLPGYTRLRILSFERLAEFIFEQQEKPAPELLSEEGRVMVLRALLEQNRTGLYLFRATARLPGFARQLSQLLRELQQYHLTPPRLEKLATEVGETNRLNAKLRDLASILRAYSEWLMTHQLQDADSLLDLAAAVLKDSQISNFKFQIGGLWLDGFAQMTPQERQLVAAVVQCSEQSTLAFCLDTEPHQPPPWHSAWAPVTETFLHCRDELSGLPGAQVRIETLARDPIRNRFQSQMLQHLERHWTRPEPFTREPSPGNRAADNAVRLVSCASPEAEVEFAAREIRRYVRERNGRFRDAAVLLRTLDGHHDAIRRVFARYEIPFFLDRRETVTHHPLAELTRYALRLVAYGWEHEDWFGALKSGLVHGDEGAIDWLENEALARGWSGRTFWAGPIQIPNFSESRVQQLESLRRKLVSPFFNFADGLGSADRRLTGVQLASAIREFWRDLKIDRKLQDWSSSAAQYRGLPNPTLHETVWTQMTEWLANIELAFSNDAIFLADWLPVVEAGLGNLTVGVIPPALDQVLVGAVDRSRNPDLQIAFVLGVNEGLFPAPPPAPALLTRADRETLANCNAPVGPDFLNQIGLERYYGYIACTRARNRIVLTFAHRDNSGHELNPSALVNDLQRLLPSIETEEFHGVTRLQEAEHWNEVIVPLLKNPAMANELRTANPTIAAALTKADELARQTSEETLAPELVEKIYGNELRTSVSALEDFAACPFRFFIGRGLRAEERVEFEIDPREKGSFQHEVLKEFHLRLKKAGRRWRDVAPAEARLLIRQIGEEMLPAFKDGLFVSAQTRRFTGQMLIEGLERLIETLIAWTEHYRFDPAVVEMSFGLDDSRLPAWRIDLDDKHALLLRGRIDRVDVCRIEETDETLAVVIDYKSSARKLDKVLLEHGLELQLLAYLGALKQFGSLEGELNVTRLIPAGAFYVALKSGTRAAQTREEEREAREETHRTGSQHRGRFDGARLSKFDDSNAVKGSQFRFSIKQDGSFARTGNEALVADEFQNLVRQAGEFLRKHGRDIYAGKVGIAPYRYRAKTACDFCDYRPVCRFDPWTQAFRVLRATQKSVFEI